MADGTKIEWATASLNPIRARNKATGKIGHYCEHASGGCLHCYSETFNQRGVGAGVLFQRQNRDQVELFLDETTLAQPLRWRRPRRIFWCSMTDAFADFVPNEWIDRIFAVAALTPQHTHMLLTKRAKRMREYHEHPDVYPRVLRAAESLRSKRPELCRVPISNPRDAAFWPHVWKGVSVEDQARADERIPDLLATPAAVRFLSCEPLLGELDLRRWLAIDWKCSYCREYFTGRHQSHCPSCGKEGGWCGSHPFNGRHYPRGPISPSQRGSGIDWTIIGGESGPKARAIELQWIRGIVSQCQTAQVPVFVKQIGAKPVVNGQTYTYYAGGDRDIRPKDRAGGDPGEWPAGLRIREMPGV